MPTRRQQRSIGIRRWIEIEHGRDTADYQCITMHDATRWGLPRVVCYRSFCAK
jgi:hypothetical protein